MTFAQLSQVWDPLTLVALAIGGFFSGYTIVGRVVRDPAYSSLEASPADYAIVTFGSSAGVIGVLQGINIAVTYLGHDLWTRVVSRTCVDLEFFLFLAVGVWVVLRRHQAARHRRILDRATRQVSADHDALPLPPPL